MDFTKEILRLKEKNQSSEFKKWSDSDNAVVRIAVMKDNVEILEELSKIDINLINSFNYLALIIANYHEKEKSKLFLMSCVKPMPFVDSEDLEDELQNIEKDVNNLFEK